MAEVRRLVLAMADHHQMTFVVISEVGEEIMEVEEEVIATMADMVHHGEARLRHMTVETPIRINPVRAVEAQEGPQEEEDHLLPPVVRDVVATKDLPVFLF